MGKFMRLNWTVLILCVLGIALSLWLIPDWEGKILAVFTIGLFFVAVQQNFAAQNSAHAADVSAQAAADSQHQATYIHLASLWYQIKQRGLECEDFISPEFTTLFRQEESLTKYRQYHVYAWMCWGHAEDCYIKGFRDDEGFLPSIENYKELHYAWLSEPKHRRMFGARFTEWVDTQRLLPHVTVKSENTRQGNGVFATAQFKRGDFVGYFNGSLVKNRTQMSLQFGPDFHVEPSVESPFRNLNHSCDANARFAGRNLYARRDIQPDEEITIDYNCHELELASPFKCNCGVTGCVGEIKGYKYLTDGQKLQRKEQICAWFEQSAAGIRG
ncbi:SET domain protein [bacterium BMS3Abin12]|nr:SET domain protein [bacterium BMS3Abin12]